jgi:hypothetical protein
MRRLNDCGSRATSSKFGALTIYKLIFMSLQVFRPPSFPRLKPHFSALKTPTSPDCLSHNSRLGC